MVEDDETAQRAVLADRTAGRGCGGLGLTSGRGDAARPSGRTGGCAAGTARETRLVALGLVRGRIDLFSQ